MSDPDKYNIRYMGSVQMKGKDKPVGIYESFAGDLPHIIDLKFNTFDAFTDAMNLYFKKDFLKASQAFNYVIKENPDDGPAKLFLERAQTLAETGVPADWTGVETMKKK